MQEPFAAIFGVIVGFAIAAVFIILFTFVFRWLWNTTVPEVFGLKQLDFLQALKILILASILFGAHRTVHMTTPDVEPVKEKTQALNGQRST